MKVWERVVEARLRKVVEICEQQYGFMPRKSTTDAIFALRILMEKYRDGQRELHCVFVDLEKAYERVPREELWYCMRKSGVAEKYVRVVQDMYERSRTVVRCAVDQTEEFNVEVGLHQGSALSPFLFAIVMDQLSEEVRQESSWIMMFADDIVICSESREQVEENLERWRFALERRGMKVSHTSMGGAAPPVVSGGEFRQHLAPAPWGVPDPSETDIVAPEPSFGGGRRLALLLGGGRRSALLLGGGRRSEPPLGCGRRVGPFGLAVGNDTSALHWWRMRAEDSEPTPGVSLEHILKHLLETSIHQQVSSQEVAQSLTLATKELQELSRGPHATAIPLPEPDHAAQCLLMKMTASDNVEAFLEAFEWTAARAG
ncbi:hypothetical protein QTP70_003179 [Hemibagrus guttatus]|uniref:ribonuclease H n=1 Tax=Hemibagrus guttatus TaxID=175788 RepID=A0AAE0QIT1_9TELE|nr:hypothetical protein QTP70_003179 [Hemibagrus guttatus]